jgi:hypothetical protein
VTSHVFVAHAESGPVDLTGMIVVGAVVAGAATWLVVTNRRLDAKEHPMTHPDVADDDELKNPPRWAQILIMGVLVVLLVGGGFLVYRAQSNLKSTQSQGVVDDLCRAADQAATDPEAALATFNSSPHNALHGIDTDLRQVDPLAAASLATAKADAEAALIAGADDAPGLTRTLAEETAAAYRTLEDDDSITGCA